MLQGSESNLKTVEKELLDRDVLGMQTWRSPGFDVVTPAPGLAPDWKIPFLGFLHIHFLASWAC